MTDAEKSEHADLVNMWNCTEPMTAEQKERLMELDVLAGLGVDDAIFEAQARQDRSKQPQ